VTGTTSDVTPIIALDGRPIGSGKPGPITLRRGAALQRRLYANTPASAELAGAR